MSVAESMPVIIRSGVPAPALFPRLLLILLLGVCSAAWGESTGSTSAAAESTPHRAEEAPGDEVRKTPPRLERGIFLIARSGLNDPNFSRSVILITHYDDTGTTGLVINRTLPIPAAEAIPPIARLGLDPGELHAGGPVAMDSLQLLIRAPGGMDESTRILDDVYLISERLALERLLEGNFSGSALRLYAGYAGWGPGQLESELLRGDWYLWPADPGHIFSAPPDSIWPKLIQQAAAHWVLFAVPASTVAHWEGRSIMAGHLTLLQPSARHDGVSEE